MRRKGKGKGKRQKVAAGEGPQVKKGRKGSINQEGKNAPLTTETMFPCTMGGGREKKKDG